MHMTLNKDTSKHVGTFSLFIVLIVNICLSDVGNKVPRQFHYQLVRSMGCKYIFYY